MKIDYILENYNFEKLSSNHELSSFNCGSQDLNDFLKNDALKQQKENLNVTQLVVCDNEIIGFVSLLADNLKLKNIDEKTKELIQGHLPHTQEVPGVKIGRFAINKKYSRNGIGTNVIGQIILEIKEISKNVGIRFIIVDAYAIAYKFYEKNNFINLEKDNKRLEKIDFISQRNPYNTFTLYQDIKKLR